MKSPQRTRLLARDPGPATPARRLDLRHPLLLPVEIIADGVTIEAESRDLCFGGMCLRADIAHAVGCDVSLSLQSPGEPRRIEFSATVVWREGALAGLVFTAVSPTQLWTLSRLFPD